MYSNRSSTLLSALVDFPLLWSEEDGHQIRARDLKALFNYIVYMYFGKVQVPCWNGMCTSSLMNNCTGVSLSVITAGATDATETHQVLLITVKPCNCNTNSCMHLTIRGLPEVVNLVHHQTMTH